ncbi:MAG: M23 family metallopeptidase [Planctomycetota bacterium]
MYKTAIAVSLILLFCLSSGSDLRATGGTVADVLQEPPHVSVELFAKNRKVIPLFYEHNAYKCTHVKPPELVIRNRSDERVTIKQVGITGFADGREMVNNTIYENRIAECMARTGRFANKLLSDPADPSLIVKLKRNYGDPAEATPDYIESHELPPSGFAALELGNELYIFYEGRVRLDALEITVHAMDESGSRSAASLHVPLLNYACRGKYHFPIKGISMVGSVPFGHSHRFARGQEFAIDILDIRRLDDGRFSSSNVPNDQVINASDKAADYFIYNRKVHAIGNGRVIEVETGFPDDCADNPQDFFIPRIERLKPELLKKGVSPTNITGGNHVIIDHGNGEFSRYCHLREEIKVKKGDTVKQGDLVGFVGNSGNSMEPHLHLELIDAADPTAANGLPLVFDDLDLTRALDSPGFGEKNSFAFSEFIFVFKE